MGVKKSKPGELPRLHEIKVDEIVQKALKLVKSSRDRITKSDLLNKKARKQIQESPSRKKK